MKYTTVSGSSQTPFLFHHTFSSTPSLPLHHHLYLIRRILILTSPISTPPFFFHHPSPPPPSFSLTLFLFLFPPPATRVRTQHSARRRPHFHSLSRLIYHLKLMYSMDSSSACGPRMDLFRHPFRSSLQVWFLSDTSGLSCDTSLRSSCKTFLQVFLLNVSLVLL